MPVARKCRGCGTDVPANAPFGHCPKCLLELGFGPLPEGWETPRSAALSSGDAFADYELLHQIGRGGMGVIYKARQITLNRLVAIKLVRPDEFASPSLIQRFHLEAEAAASLHHPNIVPIYETGEHQGQHFFSMELIEGKGLDRYISTAGFAFGEEKASRARHEQIAQIMAKVSRAVDYAHQHGVLHRDLKPSNIILDQQGEPHLTDFGVAKLIGHTGSGLTASGAIMGTPSYMAPEQAAGKSKRVTTAADTYSLGAILYEMLTGHPPFRADTPVETLKQVVEEEPRHPSTLKDSIDRDLATICMKCLEKEPQRRYPSAAALGDDLERWLHNEPIEARPTGPIFRARRWIQRNPAPAMLILTLALGLAACVGLLHLARQQESAKEQALEVIKRGLDKRLNDLWLDPNRGAFEHVTASELGAYVGSEWLQRRGPTNTLAFGVYVYTKPAQMLSTLSPILFNVGNELAATIGSRIEIELLIFRSYEGALGALEEGRLHFMRMGPAPYVQIKTRSAAMQLLAIQVHAEPLSLAIFVPAKSSIRNLADLRGKRFAFGDTNSTTGNYVPKWLLFTNDLRQGELAGFAHLQSQSEVIASVTAAKFDAGAVNYDLIRERADLRTIAKVPLDNLGLCWVGGPRLNPALATPLRNCFLSVTDPSVLSRLESHVTGFRLLGDHVFDPLRHMMRQAELFSEPR